jgi:hypothetical protein
VIADLLCSFHRTNPTWTSHNQKEKTYNFAPQKQ